MESECPTYFGKRIFFMLRISNLLDQSEIYIRTAKVKVTKDYLDRYEIFFFVSSYINQ